MRITNTLSTTVPSGHFEGLDLQEFATEHTAAAYELLGDSTFRREYADHYYDLDYYLRALPKAKRWMARH
jgi:hypothetical protein